ncbi:PTS ascorbate transporter subunit IIC [Corynebacterium diphtheriae]|nr:PTS ascorbate transporter subunit IIC [Corynebacterium diphtheriae]CAB1047950.1 PTS ascorbate transporter subunit IIC [Corynebacterium diphtheriae]
MLVGGGARVGGRLGIVLVILVGLVVFALGWFSQVKLVQGNWDPTPWCSGFAAAGAAAGAPVPPSHHSGVFRRIFLGTSHQIASKPAVWADLV